MSSVIFLIPGLTVPGATATAVVCDTCQLREATVELADDGWVCEECERNLPAHRIAACEEIMERQKKVSNQSEIFTATERLEQSINAQDWGYLFADGSAYYKGANNWDQLRARAIVLADYSSDADALEVLNRCVPAEVLADQGTFTADHLSKWREAKRRGAIRA